MRKKKCSAKRIGRSILTLFIIVTLVFCLLRLMPVEGYFANYEKMTEAQIQAGLQSMGLLDPLPVQVGRFWVNALHGDLGVSHIYKVNASVTSILAKKLPISIQMGVFAMLLSLVIGIPMGLFMGRFKSRWPDKLGTAIIVLIQAVPAAVYYLYIQMYGTTALGVGLLFDTSNWKYWVLPVCSMSLGNVAFYAMWLRRYMVDESNKDYVRLARAKGVSENNIALRHIFRNAMVPLVQYIPSAFLNTVVGSIYIESLYSIPGMGGLLVTCVQRHDNTRVQGIVPVSYTHLDVYKRQDWGLLQYPFHDAFQKYFASLSRLYATQPALYAGEYDPRCFEWVASESRDEGVYAWLRKGAGQTILCVMNTQNTAHKKFPLYLRFPAGAEELLNTEAPCWGGADKSKPKALHTTDGGVYGRDYTLTVDLPAMGSRMFRLTPEAPRPEAAQASARRAAAARRKAARTQNAKADAAAHNSKK